MKRLYLILFCFFFIFIFTTFYLSLKNNNQLVVYLSMAFGNPYAENYHPDIVAELTEKLHKLEVKTIALSDTILFNAFKRLRVKLFSRKIF